VIGTNVLQKSQVDVCRLDQFRSERKKETTRENKDGLRREKLPEVVKTAYGPNGELQVVRKNVNL
jgi:hypothetical protein